MELKNTKSSSYVKLIKHSLKEKRSWFMLSAIVLVITVIILPVLLKASQMENFIIVGMIEVIILTYLNCMIDYNYLHDPVKYAYVMSKPISAMKRINVTIITNLIYSFVLMLPLIIMVLINGSNVEIFFIIPLIYLIVGIFLAPLSALLAGNTIIASLATIINFALPLLILGVVYFGMGIVEGVTLGFRSDILISMFIEHFYKVDYLYFIGFILDYERGGVINWLGLISLLVVICSILYLITIRLIKKRKNSRIGQMIVFTGYKNFVALLLSVMVPFILTMELASKDYMAKLVLFVILGSITYYISLAILEKSFRLKKGTIKFLLIFMSLFICFVSITGVIIKRNESMLPDISNVKGVLITSVMHLDVGEESWKSVDNIEFEDRKYDNINILTSKEAIEAAINLQRTIVNDQSYKYPLEISFVYFLENDETFYRYYKLGYESSSYSNDEPINEELDEATLEIQLTSEYQDALKNIAIFDQYIYKLKEIDVTLGYLGSDGIYSEERYSINEEQLIELEDVLKKDLENIIVNENGSLLVLSDVNLLLNNSYYYSNQFPDYRNSEDSNKPIRLFINGRYLYINKTFIETLKYIDSL